MLHFLLQESYRTFISSCTLPHLSKLPKRKIGNVHAWRHYYLKLCKKTKSACTVQHSVHECICKDKVQIYFLQTVVCKDNSTKACLLPNFLLFICNRVPHIKIKKGTKLHRRKDRLLSLSWKTFFTDINNPTNLEKK